MQINELIENRLNTKFPGKTIKMIMEVDGISFQPFHRLVVNGRLTTFGFDHNAMLREVAIGQLSFDAYADKFVENVSKGMELGHTL